MCLNFSSFSKHIFFKNYPNTLWQVIGDTLLIANLVTQLGLHLN